MIRADARKQNLGVPARRPPGGGAFPQRDGFRQRVAERQRGGAIDRTPTAEGAKLPSEYKYRDKAKSEHNELPESVQTHLACMGCTPAEYPKKAMELCSLCDQSDPTMPHALGWCLKLLASHPRGQRILGPTRAAAKVRQLLGDKINSVADCAECIALAAPSENQAEVYAVAQDIIEHNDLCATDPVELFFEAVGREDASLLAYYSGNAGLQPVASQYAVMLQ